MVVGRLKLEQFSAILPDRELRFQRGLFGESFAIELEDGGWFAASLPDDTYSLLHVTSYNRISFGGSRQSNLRIGARFTVPADSKCVYVGSLTRAPVTSAKELVLDNEHDEATRFAAEFAPHCASQLIWHPMGARGLHP